MSLSGKYRFTTATVTTDDINIQPYITDLVMSGDIDRSPFWQATITLDHPTAAIITATDPRGGGFMSGTVSFVVWHDVTYPGGSTVSQPLGQVILFIDSSTYDWQADQLMIEASSAEMRMQDYRNVSTTAIDSGATNLLALFQWCNSRVGGLPFSVTDALSPTAASVAIPAGDRRLMQPGETAEDVYTPELSAAGGRAFCSMVGAWRLANREDPPDQVAGYGTIIANMYSLPTADTMFAVTSARQTTSRDGWAGGWADGALVHYSYVDGTGTRQERWQSSGTSNSRGLLIEIDRAPGAANYATAVAARAIKRGSQFDITGSVNFNVRPGASLTLRRASGDVAAGIIRSVEWRLGDDEMTVTTQIGAPT